MKCISIQNHQIQRVLADLPSNTIDNIAFKVHDGSMTLAAPNVTGIPDNNNHESTWQTTHVEQLLEPSHMSIIDLHNVVSKSTDKLFFVQYTPAGTM